MRATRCSAPSATSMPPTRITSLNWDINGAMYGRVALGLPPDATL